MKDPLPNPSLHRSLPLGSVVKSLNWLNHGGQSFAPPSTSPTKMTRWIIYSSVIRLIRFPRQYQDPSLRTPRHPKATIPPGGPLGTNRSHKLFIRTKNIPHSIPRSTSPEILNTHHNHTFHPRKTLFLQPIPQIPHSIRGHRTEINQSL